MGKWEIDTSKIHPRWVEEAESALFWAEYKANLLNGNCDPGEMPAGLAERIQANPGLVKDTEFAAAQSLAYKAVEIVGRALEQYAPSDWALSELTNDLDNRLVYPDCVDICPLAEVFDALFNWPDMSAYHTVLHPHVPSIGMRDLDEFRSQVEWWVRAWVALSKAPDEDEEKILEAILEGDL